MKEVIAYKTIDKTVFGPIDSWVKKDILANGEELVETYLRDFYQVEGDLTSLLTKTTKLVSTRYELKNKALYNERIPLIIDDTTKDIYKELVETELYERINDYEVVYETIPFREVEIDTSFDKVNEKSSITLWNNWKNMRETRYYIDMVEFSVVDQCLIPRPLLDLTRPCALSGDNLYRVVADHIAKEHMPMGIRIKENSDYSFTISNVSKNELLSFRRSDFEKKAVFAKDYAFLRSNLEAFAKAIVLKLGETNPPYTAQQMLSDYLQGVDFTKLDKK